MKFNLLKKHRNDIILITLLLFISLIILLILNLTKTEGGYAVVIINGQETASYPLDKQVEIKLENGDEYNVLVIENGMAKIKEASCPDKLCVKQHEVHYNGETLVCLPNKTTVKIVSEINSEIDLIS